MAINIKPSHEGKFHEWAKVPNGQEIPISKIKQGDRSPHPAVRKSLASRTTPGIGIAKADAMTVTATAKRRRRQSQARQPLQGPSA
jgi:hypothetical protein